MFELMDAYSQSAVIKVIGVGGGGGNAVAHMVTAGIDGVEFMCINTDAQALKHAKVKTALQIGCNMTRGLGAGADPEVGRQAAMEDRDRIVELVEGCDMLFITCGMGGGTGTGAAPVVAQVAKELGILTVAVVTKPFEMEGNKRSFVADHGIAELGKYCDSLITIPNQKLLTVLGPQTTLLDAFKSANQVLQGAVQGIAELITRPGLINVDFADVRTVMATLIRPGRVISSAIPCTAPCNTWFADLNASSNVVCGPSTVNSFWLGMVISESQYLPNSAIP